MSSPGITSTRDLEFWADDDLALGQFYGDERPALLVSELARGFLASRDRVKELEAEVERLRKDPRLTLTLEHLSDTLGAMRYNNCAPPGRYDDTEAAINAVCWELARDALAGEGDENE